MVFSICFDTGLEYLVLMSTGGTEPCCCHVGAANGLDLLHTTELGLQQQLQNKQKLQYP